MDKDGTCLHHTRYQIRYWPDPSHAAPTRAGVWGYPDISKLENLFISCLSWGNTHGRASSMPRVLSRSFHIRRHLSTAPCVRVTLDPRLPVVISDRDTGCDGAGGTGRVGNHLLHRRTLAAQATGEVEYLSFVDWACQSSCWTIGQLAERWRQRRGDATATLHHSNRRKPYDPAELEAVRPQAR